jgi:hypothetical protein
MFLPGYGPIAIADWSTLCNAIYWSNMGFGVYWCSRYIEYIMEPATSVIPRTRQRHASPLIERSCLRSVQAHVAAHLRLNQ